jgi:hypothetical protein
MSTTTLLIAAGSLWLALGFLGFWIQRKSLLKRVVRGADEMLIAVVLLGGPATLAAMLIVTWDERRQRP